MFLRSYAALDVIRQARVGALVEQMPCNTALFKLNNGKWASRNCVMDAVWDLNARGYKLPHGKDSALSPFIALDAIKAVDLLEEKTVEQK